MIQLNDWSMHQRVWALAWPMLLSNITVPLLGLVDSAVVGHLDDPKHLGAVAIGATLFTTIYWAFGFLRMGTTGLVAQAVGRQDGSANRTFLAQATLIALGLGSLMWLAQIPILTLGLEWMGADPDVHETARSYADIRIFGAPAALFNYVLVGWFVGNQDTRSPLIIMTVVNLINLVLDLLFVLGFGWGAEGVASATLIAEYAGVILGLVLIKRHLKVIDGAILPNALRQLSAYRDIFTVNKYLFVRTASLLFMFAFFTSQGARLGTDILSANALLLNFLMLISHALDGFAHAAEAICGRYAGAKDRDKFYRAMKSSALWSLVFALGLTLTFLLGGHFILSLMTSIESVLAVAHDYLIFIWVLPVIAVWSYFQDGVLVGTTQSKAMLQIMVVTVFGTFLPLWWLTQGLGNTGLWLSFTAAFLVRALMGFWIFHRYNQRGVWFSA